jgi:glycosyltransferase involved in cell wall biosynthesis
MADLPFGTAGVPLRIALYSGLCIRHDAISNSLRLKLQVIDRWQAGGAAVKAVAFVHSSDCEDPRIHRLASVTDVLRYKEFWAADVHVFEFGIYYPLFDAVFLLAESVPTVAVYHNITPPELVDDPATRVLLERSIVQRHNFSRMRHIVADSDYSRGELLALGFPPEQLSVIPLPPAQRLAPRSRERHVSDRVELLYVGRLVRAKGVLDLLEAISLLTDWGASGFRLTIAGNPALSSPAVLDEVRRCAEGSLSGHLRFIPAPEDETLAELYATSDVFVIPSYHEGYCVPVVEALVADCLVVAYDSSNLPFVLGGLGTLVPTGSVEGLADALAQLLQRFRATRTEGAPLRVPTQRGELEEAEWRREVRVHLDQHSEAMFESKFADLLRVVTAPPNLLRAGAPAEATR